MFIVYFSQFICYIFVLFFQPDAPKLRILHITDLHIDNDYIPGSNSDCGEPICCRQGDGMARM